MRTWSTDLAKHARRPINSETIDRAKWHVLDWFGIALAASTTTEGRRIIDLPWANLGHGSCIDISGTKRHYLDAAFVMGCLGNILEMDDVHNASILHAGDIIIPAALVSAQLTNADGDALLKAITRGYEIALIIGECAAKQGYSSWYNSSTCGIFGGCFASALLFGLNEQQQCDALGHAGMQASGLWQCRLEPTVSKSLVCGHAARAAVHSAWLSQVDMPGPHSILEGDLGFFATLYPQAAKQLPSMQQEQQFKIFEVSFKPWPACRHSHAAIQAALELKNKVPQPEQYFYDIHTYQAAQMFCDNAEPQTDHEARFSLQHAVAYTLLKGEPEVGWYDAKNRQDDDIAALRHKMRVLIDDDLNRRFPGAMPTTVMAYQPKTREVVETAHVNTPLGDPENPMSEEDLCAKFKRNVKDFDQANVDMLLNSLLSLPIATSLNNINNHLTQMVSQNDNC